MQQGEFSLAFDRVSSMRREALETDNAGPLVRAAVTIDGARSPLPRHEQEHLLRLAVETLVDTVREDTLEDGEGLEELGALLEEFDTYESSRLRTAMIDLASRLVQDTEYVDPTRWRSALQRRGHTLESELSRQGGRPNDDVAEEAVVLLGALGETGDPAVSGLVTRIRRESRIREIVEAAREAQTMLRPTQ